jgi:hypothetical protein
VAYTRSSPVQSILGIDRVPRVFNVLNEEEERINLFAPPRPSATDGTIVVSRDEYKAWLKRRSESEN